MSLITRVLTKPLMLLMFLSAAPASAQQQLNNLALFHRCYHMIVQDTPDAALTLQVKNGLSYVDACMQVLEAGLLSDGGLRLPAGNSPLARKVLGNMHRLHTSWFFNKDYEEIAAEFAISGTRNFFDITTPAAYFTKALLDPNPDFRVVVTSNQYLRPLRTNDNPDTGVDGTNKAQSLFSSSAHAGIGGLLGFTAPATNTTWNFTAATDGPATGSVTPYAQLGGGIMGNATYMLLSVNATVQFRADGGVATPRKWSRSIFNDLFCRELPVVREADVASFVVTSSALPFRQSQSCVRCHASIDRMASTLRQFHYQQVRGDSANNAPHIGGFFSSFYSTTQTAETGWPAAADASFHLRPTNGTLYYRSFSGDLINVALTSVPDMGAKIALQDDIYVCAAKRYYQYFTNVDVSLGDLGDPTTPALTAKQITHRNLVIQLGQQLKQSRNPRALIRSILMTDIFKRADLGARN